MPNFVIRIGSAPIRMDVGAAQGPAGPGAVPGTGFVKVVSGVPQTPATTIDVSLIEGISTFAETLLDDADASAARTTLGLGTVLTDYLPLAGGTMTGVIESGSNIVTTSSLYGYGVFADSGFYGGNTGTQTFATFPEGAAATGGSACLFPFGGGTLQAQPTEGAFANGDKTKLDGIEALADVTDTANVTAAGALMDSEVTNLAAVKAFNPADYATAPQGTDERVPTAAGLTSKFSTNKATIVDADQVAILDSAAAFAPKHSLFSLVKSTLKTYFDTLYALAVHTHVSADVTNGVILLLNGAGDIISGRHHVWMGNSVWTSALTVPQATALTSDTRITNLTSNTLELDDPSLTENLIIPAGHYVDFYMQDEGGGVFSFALSDAVLPIVRTIVGITGTTAQFNTALADGDFATEAYADAKVAQAITSSITVSAPSQAAVHAALAGKANSLGVDDNYVTDAEKTVIGNTSGTNTGDETGARVASLITAATAKTVIVDADVTDITDSEASHGFKKVTFTSIWTWISTKLAAITSQTIGGAISFSSATRPTSSGTGDPSLASLTTASDVFRLSFFASGTLLIPSTGSTSYTAASGQVANDGGAFQLFTANATPNSRSGVRWKGGFALGTGWNQINFDVRYAVVMGVWMGMRAGIQLYFQIGRTYGAVTSAQLDKKGFGVGLVGGTYTPFVHNGSAITNGTTFSNPGKVILEFIPGVSFSAYSFTPTGGLILLSTITTGLPSGMGITGDDQVEYIKYDTGAGGAGDWVYIHTPLIRYN